MLNNQIFLELIYAVGIGALIGVERSTIIPAKDTSYIIGFNGMEVPTSNHISYSNSNGEINNMIAPVRSMIGDTMKLSYNTSDTQNHIYIVLD